MTGRWRSWLVVLCAVVVMLATSVEASHFHHDGVPDTPLSTPVSKKSGTSCLICNALHTPAPSEAATHIGVAVSGASEPILTRSQSPTRLEDFGLFVRPPPN